jgi:hypothetical protein
MNTESCPLNAPAELICSDGHLVPDYPVAPVRPRLDGWTVDRQRAFLEALADTGCVTPAARSVGMSPESAYRLRRKPGAEAFGKAWDGAIAHGIKKLTDIALERAITGTPSEVWFKGEHVGTRPVFSERLLTFLLTFHNPRIYTAAASTNDRPTDLLRSWMSPFRKLLNQISRDPEDTAT